MNIIKNVSEGIYPYQQALWDKLSQGGFKYGEMMLISAGRSTGKSMLNQMFSSMAGVQPMTSNAGSIFTIKHRVMKTKPKYQFSRAKWYEAKLPKDGQGAFNWCVKQFGPEPKNPDAWTRWYFNVDRKFRFRDSKDYEWFILRWS